MAPLFINTLESRVRVIILKESFENTLGRLQEIGVLHGGVAKGLNAMDKATIESRRNDVGKVFVLIQDILKFLVQEKGRSFYSRR